MAYETDEPAAAMAGALLGIGRIQGLWLVALHRCADRRDHRRRFRAWRPIKTDRSLAKLDVAHTFIAIDIDFFLPVDSNSRRVWMAFIAEIKSSALRPGIRQKSWYRARSISIAGRQSYRQDGAQLDSNVYQRLSQLADTLGISFDRSKRTSFAGVALWVA